MRDGQWIVWIVGVLAIAAVLYVMYRIIRQAIGDTRSKPLLFRNKDDCEHAQDYTPMLEYDTGGRFTNARTHYPRRFWRRRR